MSDIVTIAGSHGAVRVHRPTGIILEEAEGCTCEDCQRLGSYVQQVALFDTADLTGGWAAYDIVYVGFWDRSGCYEPAISHRFHHHPSGFVDVDCSTAIWMRTRDNEDENPVCWDRRGA